MALFSVVLLCWSQSNTDCWRSPTTHTVARLGMHTRAPANLIINYSIVFSLAAFGLCETHYQFFMSCFSLGFTLISELDSSMPRCSENSGFRGRDRHLSVHAKTSRTYPSAQASAKLSALARTRTELVSIITPSLCNLKVQGDGLITTRP